MWKNIFLFAIVVALAATVAQSATPVPGLEVAVNQSAGNYLANLFLPLIASKIRSITVPEIQGEASTFYLLIVLTPSPFLSLYLYLSLSPSLYLCPCLSLPPSTHTHALPNVTLPISHCALPLQRSRLSEPSSMTSRTSA